MTNLRADGDIYTPFPDDPVPTTNDELRDLVYRLKYPPSKGAYQVKVDDIMNAIRKDRQELLKRIEVSVKDTFDELEFGNPPFANATSRDQAKVFREYIEGKIQAILKQLKEEI